MAVFTALLVPYETRLGFHPSHCLFKDMNGLKVNAKVPDNKETVLNKSKPNNYSTLNMLLTI